MSTLADFWAVARLDLAEVLRSRWLLFCVGVYVVLAGIFVLVGMRESTVLGFTGMGRVLMSFSHGLTLILPLLALTATGQLVNRAREDGTLEFLLSQPFRRTAYFAAVTLTRLVLLIVPLVVLISALGLVSQLFLGESVPWAFVGRAMAICSALVTAFVAIGLTISTFVRTQAKAATYTLLAWLVGVLLLDFGLIGMLLQWRIHPPTVFVLAAANPVQAARMALLSGADPELSVFGPVGYFLANRVGSLGLFALGLAWPLVLGAGLWLLSLAHFRRSDVV